MVEHLADGRGPAGFAVLAEIEGNLGNLAFDADDRLFTTAFADGQLLALNPGRQLRALNQTGFIAPGGVAADADGTVWVGDFFSLRGMGSSRNPDTGVVIEDIRTLAVPTNAIRHGGALVAAQGGAGNVVDANSGDEILGGLFFPLGMASGGTKLYVSDWATGVEWAVPDDGSIFVSADGTNTVYEFRR